MTLQIFDFSIATVLQGAIDFLSFFKKNKNTK